MSKKYHINSKGLVKACRAEKRPCPFGGADGKQNHFSSKEEAQQYVDKQNESQFGIVNGVSNEGQSGSQDSITGSSNGEMKDESTKESRRTNIDQNDSPKRQDPISKLNERAFNGEMTKNEFIKESKRLGIDPNDAPKHVTASLFTRELNDAVEKDDDWESPANKAAIEYWKNKKYWRMDDAPGMLQSKKVMIMETNTMKKRYAVASASYKMLVEARDNNEISNEEFKKKEDELKTSLTKAMLHERDLFMQHSNINAEAKGAIMSSDATLGKYVDFSSNLSNQSNYARYGETSDEYNYRKDKELSYQVNKRRDWDSPENAKKVEEIMNRADWGVRDSKEDLYNKGVMFMGSKKMERVHKNFRNAHWQLMMKESKGIITKEEHAVASEELKRTFAKYAVEEIDKEFKRGRFFGRLFGGPSRSARKLFSFKK